MPSEGRDPSRESMVSSYEYDEEFEMLVSAFLRDMDYTSVNQTALNIIYSMINAGLIALPYAASQGGIILYSLLVFIISLMSAYTSIIVISMANEQKVRTLEDLAECAFGPRGFFAVSFFQILFSFAVMAITLDVYADIMIDVFGPSPYQNWLLTNRIGQLILGSIVVVPLCILKTSMSNLKWTSYVTVTAMCAAVITVIGTYLSEKDGEAIVKDGDNLSEVLLPKTNWWFTLFLAVFSFSCNQKVMTVYSSLRQRSVSRWKVAVKRGYSLLTVVYLIFGVFGYISVKRLDLDMEDVNFFIGDGYERKDVFDAARVTVALALLLTIPVDCLVAATTWRRFHSKYMKIYHQGTVHRASPFPSFFDKCMVRLSIISASTNHASHCADEEELAEREHSEDNKKVDEEMKLTAQGTEVVPRPLPAVRTASRTTSRSISRSAAVPPPPLAMVSSSPARFTRKSRPIRGRSSSAISSATHGDHDDASSAHAHSGRVRTLTGSSGVTPSTSFHSGSHGREVSYSDDRSVSEERVVDESGWNMYSTLLAGNAAALAAQYDDPIPGTTSFSSGHGGSVSMHKVSGGEDYPLPPEELLARQVTYPAHARAHEHSMIFNTSHSLAFDLPEGVSEWQVYWHQLSPALILYTLCFLTCCGIQHWLYLAASLCTLSTAILLFIFPSILYFRLGLVSDYQSIPLIYNVLPNQVYMYIIQITGMAFVLFDVLLLFYFIFRGEHFVESKS